MFTVLNVVLILLVLLIAYWWANQGLFSAILHLICVIAAGALALAVWEPINTTWLLKIDRFEDYAWGVSFIVLFVVFLLILRYSMDKLVGANVNIPNWANVAFGLPVGAAAGILTMGLFMIGAGHLQSGRELMGMRGYARSVQTGQIEAVDRLWLPVHEWTYQFYSLVSVGSLYPTFNDSPLRQYSPRLDLQAVSLLRDSAEGGRGKFSLRPSDANIVEYVVCADPQYRRYAVKVQFGSGARDFGEQLTLSAAQVRLIGSAPENNRNAEPPVAFPDSWAQYDGWHNFDDVTHYVTSQPGQSDATVWLFFDGRNFGSSTPKFIQIRGTRFSLPAGRDVTLGDYNGIRG